MIEPDETLHHIFYDQFEAFTFWEALPEEGRPDGPRQSHGGTWIIDKERPEWQS